MGETDGIRSDPCPKLTLLRQDLLSDSFCFEPSPGTHLRIAPTMADPNDPYLIALPPVPCLTLKTTLDMKPDGYFERPVVATVLVDHRGANGTLHLI